MVSIIVPVYNAQRYLKACVQSLLAQTERDIEIILIDDGSTDGSGEICDAYAVGDARVRVIHQDNAGVSAARNAGLAIAKGQYIGFVDSDDWVAEDYVETLLHAIDQSGADLAVCGMWRVRGHLGYALDATDCKKIVDAQGLARDMLHDRQVGGFLWNKLFKRELLTEGFHAELHVCEDFVFCAQYAMHVQKAVVLSCKKYYYWQNPGRKLGFPTERSLSLFDAQERLHEIYSELDPALCSQIEKNILKAALHFRAKYLIHHAPVPERIEQVIAQKYDTIYSHSGALSRLNLYLTHKCPVLTLYIKSFLLKKRL